MRFRIRFLYCLGLAAALACGVGERSSPHKIHVMLGMHGNFYHSWRGDTPDEAGFGTDIRVVREILRILDEAEAEGLDARVYWDIDNHFTLETILPLHAPDIIEKIRRRVRAGRDEVLPMSYDNGMLAAMTEDEARAAIRWAISNPWGSGLRDLFGSYTPLLRPQEGMATAGLIPILRDEGIEGLVLAYSSYSFTTFSNFVAPLPPEQRFNPLWLRLREGGPRTLLLPCVSIGDVLNEVSLEMWMLSLRELQLSGEVERDLVIHFNFDADAESWLPVEGLPPGLGWIPNAGGLREYIEAVNAHDWAEFTTPARYLADHDPVGEITVRQDLADGAFDGQYSWAEKLPSHALWTGLDQARLAERRARAWSAGPLAADLRPLLGEGRGSSFFARIRALSTTHFGMSTPLVNEERQAVAEEIVATARDRAQVAERLAAERATARRSADPEALYAFEIRDLRDPASGPATRSLLRVPLWLPADAPPLVLLDERGEAQAHALADLEAFDDGVAAELWTLQRLAPGERRVLSLAPARRGEAPGVAGETLAVLENARLRLELDRLNGVAGLHLEEWQVGGEEFLSPFVSYRSGEWPERFEVEAWEPAPLADERWLGFSRARSFAAIRLNTPAGPAEVALRVDFTLPDDAPWLVADVEVEYPYTPKRDLLHNVQQKLRRYLDLRWVEVAPFQLQPQLVGTPSLPLQVWKHNHLGVISSYELDYGRINPRNRHLDAFNHQITAAWVAVSDRDYGLLLAQSAERRSSHAFAPMRLRELEGRQQLRINPFGSYHGRQLDYTHLGGNGIGTEFGILASPALRPNGPSYAGASERFSLLIAPYAGDAPPAELRAEAEAFHHPPALYFLTAPDGMQLPRDVRARVENARRQRARQIEGPLPVPPAFLLNPTRGAADAVWDEPRDARIEGYEVAWRAADAVHWRTARVGRVRRHRIEGLENGIAYGVRVRAVGEATVGPWSETRIETVGPVPIVEAGSALDGAPFRLLGRIFYHSLRHWWHTL